MKIGLTQRTPTVRKAGFELVRYPGLLMIWAHLWWRSCWIELWGRSDQ